MFPIQTLFILFIITLLTACGDTPTPSKTASTTQTTASTPPLFSTQNDTNTQKLTPAPSQIPTTSDNAPIVNQLSSKPIITDSGPTLILEAGTAFDIKDDQGVSIINADTPLGSIPIHYQVTDTVTINVTVIIKDTAPPTLRLNSSAITTHEAGSPYPDPITASDAVDGNLTAKINITGTVNNNLPGIYTLTYNVTDASGNAALPITRTVTVVLPAITGVTLTVAPKELKFAWTAVAGADHYQLSENPNGGSGFNVIANNITTTAYNHPISVHKIDWLSAQYIVEACDLNGACVSSPNQVLKPINSVAATLYLKASNAEKDDRFGHSISLSADGTTLAVGAPGESSNANGINGNQANNTVMNSGAVYLFNRTGNTWNQQSYIKASNPEIDDAFGINLSLSADGNTLAIAAGGEDSSATGVNGNETDNAAPNSGAVYIFSRTGNTWSQQAYIKASNTRENDAFGAGNSFGNNVSLSGDGMTLAVGAHGEDSGATGIGISGSQTDISAIDSGAVYLFSRNGNTWSQKAYIKASNTRTTLYGMLFGTAISLDSNGTTLAVGAHREDSGATGINGNQANGADRNGAVYLFSRTGNIWSQQAYIKAFNTDKIDSFGTGVSLSGDGNTLVVEARNEDSKVTGINGDDKNNDAASSGAVYLFNRTGTTWSHQAYIKASNTETLDIFGYSAALSSDGKTLAIGAGRESSSARGIEGDQADNNAPNSGAAYLFEYSDTNPNWNQSTYIKASNTKIPNPPKGVFFGTSISLSGDGKILAVGAPDEDGGATGIDGDQTNNNTLLSGAVYLY